MNNEKEKTNIYNGLANKNIQWHFIPPSSPHFGGLWEAGVKSFKHHMVRTVGDNLLTWEAFLTYITEIEAILNSRPLTPLSTDPNDLRVLTPAHFIIGDSITKLPERNHIDTPDNRLSNWENVQKMKQLFWSRWTKEYLNEQTVKKKWHTGGNFDAKIGTIILMKDDNLSPLQWKLARIIELHPGKDNIVRAVTVSTGHAQYKRCVRKIAPLPIDNVSNEIDE